MVLAPKGVECFYNRALAYAALGDDERALHDYNQALRLHPAFGPAALNRGMLLYRMGRFAEAEADLRLALAQGEDPATVSYHLTLAQSAQHDQPAALESIDLARRHRPASKLARDLQTRLRREPK
jgi:Flp pilus assembly protein TadD